MALAPSTPQSSNREDTHMGEMNEKGAKNELKGAIKETAGKIKGDVGDALDNSKMHADGRAEQFKGKIQKTVGKAQRALDPDIARDPNDTDDRQF
jgi:uncharacterized protein YjbJ (UPF0337 family)